MINEQEYLENRVNTQIEYYDKASIKNKKWYLRLKVVETVLALMIPFLTGYITTGDNAISLKVMVGLLGIIVAAAANLVTIFKFQENWIGYRNTAEILRHENYLYITKSGSYNGDNAFPVLVERVEDILAKENTGWVSYIKTSASGQNKQVP
jgi:hypothetical protein